MRASPHPHPTQVGTESQASAPCSGRRSVCLHGTASKPLGRARSPPQSRKRSSGSSSSWERSSAATRGAAPSKTTSSSRWVTHSRPGGMEERGWGAMSPGPSGSATTWSHPGPLPLCRMRPSSSSDRMDGLCAKAAARARSCVIVLPGLSVLRRLGEPWYQGLWGSQPTVLVTARDPAWRSKERNRGSARRPGPRDWSPRHRAPAVLPRESTCAPAPERRLAQGLFGAGRVR